jgi:hypothetical protein
MAEQFWLANSFLKRLVLSTILCGSIFCGIASAQDSMDAPPQGPAMPPPDAAQRASDAKVKALLNEMVQALGGDKWLNLPGFETNGRTAGFYKGRPNGSTAEFVAYHAYPDKDRIELGKKHDVVELILGNEGWEVTYKGKAPIPQKDLEDALRRRDHSIEVAVRQWMKDPGTLYVNGGQTTVERHLVDRVTLISTANDNITLELDAQTHLPVRRSFEWRDPVYKDQNVDADEYELYHLIDGIQTPFSVTRIHNDDMVSQRFLYNATYGGPVPPEMFDVDAVTAKIAKNKPKK